jgi:hypothetical protein
MVYAPVLQCEFLIPTCRDCEVSDGLEHEVEEWEWLDTELFLRFDGGTLAPGLYSGFYRDPDTGQRVNDESHKFIVAVTESKVDQIREMLAAACVRFEQKCIYLSVAGRVEFIEASDSDPG